MVLHKLRQLDLTCEVLIALSVDVLTGFNSQVIYSYLANNLEDLILGNLVTG